VDAKEARELSREIAKSSRGVVIKQGKTNGRVCLHLTVSGSNYDTTTIYHAWEWDEHPQNQSYQRRLQKQEDRDLAEVIANR